jgi:hypothetical protein
VSAAAFLRATATNMPASDQPGEGAEEIFAAAFRLAVRLRFKPDVPLAAIAATVRSAAQRHTELLLPVREAEMLIREALGESVPTAEMAAADTVKVHVLMFAALVEELALTDAELDELLAQAG